MFCSKCGTEVKNGALFCQNCGANQNINLKNSSSPSEILPSTKTSSVSIGSVSKTTTKTAFFSKKRVFKPHQHAYIHPPKDKIPLAETPHNGSVGLAEAIKLFFVNYINFSTRASKSEYWWALLFQVLAGVTVGLTMLIPFIGIIIGGIMILSLIIPSLSVTVRRLHDIGKPGVWCFLSLVPFVGIIVPVLCSRDSDGDNQWGRAPTGVGSYGNATSSSVSIATAQRVMSDNDIFVIVQNHEPFDLDSPKAKKYLDGALSKILPAYTGAENLADIMEQSDPEEISYNLAVTDTDSLVVIVKALGYYIGEGIDENILGALQREVVSVLKTRF